MKRRIFGTSQTGDIVDVSNARLLREDTVGNHKIQVYTEPVDEVSQDFFFTIDGRFFRTVKEYNINDLYRIYCIVQETLTEHIEKDILPLIKEGSKLAVYIGACGASTQEIESKNQVYKRQLERLVKKYNCNLESVDGDYVLKFN